MNTTINPKTYDPTPARRVAFLGLGVMGFPMAGHLALAGHAVTVYNRNATKSEAFCAQLASAGAVKRAETPSAAAAGADIVFCCVGNDEDLRSVLFDEFGDSLFTGFATITADVEKRLADWGSDEADEDTGDDEESASPKKGLPEKKKRKLLYL